jgi:WD40 repeat protein
MKWEKYLELRGFKDDIVNGLEQQTKAMISEQEKTAEQLAISQLNTVGTTIDTLSQGFGAIVTNQEEIIDTIAYGFGDISYGLDRVSKGIENLRSDFNWAMSALLWKLEMQQETLKSILSTLQAPLDTQAKELRKRAEYAYQQGWYDEALNDFVASEQKNYQDFAIHQAIGNIYLYHHKPANLEGAREYYLKAGKYAKPESSYHAALGYMHAGFVCYLMGNDKAAIEYAHKATQLHPRLVEAFYNHAKFAAAASLPDIAVPSLEIAIRSDWKYAIKARVDQDFLNIEKNITELMKGLLAETRSKTVDTLNHIDEKLSNYFVPQTFRDRIQTKTLKARKMLEGTKTYVNALEAQKRANECKYLWRYVSGNIVVKESTEHSGLETPVAFSPNGKLLAFGSTSNRYDLELYEMYEEFGPNGDQVIDETLDEYAGKGEYDEDDVSVGVWDIQARKILFRLEYSPNGTGKVEFSPDGRFLASNADEIKLWDLMSGEKEQINLGHGGFAFMPNSSKLAIDRCSDEQIQVELVDIEVELADMELTDVEKDGRNIFVKNDNNDLGYMKDIVFDSKGTMLAGLFTMGILVWGVESGERLLKIDVDNAKSVAFNPNSKTIALIDERKVRIWDINADDQIEAIEFDSYVNDVAYSPDGSILAIAEFFNIYLWDTSLGEELTILKGPKDINSLAYSPDGAMLVSGESFNTVRLWGQAVLMSEYKQWRDAAKRRKRKREQKELERQELERKKRERELQQANWRAANRCIICGKKLKFFEKLFGETKCKTHRIDS